MIFEQFCNEDKCEERTNHGYCGFIRNSMPCPWMQDRMFDKEENENG